MAEKQGDIEQDILMESRAKKPRLDNSIDTTKLGEEDRGSLVGRESRTVERMFGAAFATSLALLLHAAPCMPDHMPDQNHNGLVNLAYLGACVQPENFIRNPLSCANLCRV